jgi:hypothetical protein
MLLHYSKIPYIEKTYLSYDEWFDKDKYNLNLALPNLPYLIDGRSNDIRGEFSLTESSAIEKYIIYKAGL